MSPTDLPLYHSAPVTPGRRPLWCLEPGCMVATEPFRSGSYKCPVCGKNYPEEDEILTSANAPEMFPRRAPAKAKPKRRARPTAVQQPLAID